MGWVPACGLPLTHILYTRPRHLQHSALKNIRLNYWHFLGNKWLCNVACLILLRHIQYCMVQRIVSKNYLLLYENRQLGQG